MPSIMINSSEKRPAGRWIPELPIVIWMVLLSVALSLANGASAQVAVATFSDGFGRALGEFALILLPSFVLAAALARQHIASDTAGRTAVLASPAAGAGMICPDTAYAALSPAAGSRKLDVAFGAYSGFKLLYPAGPLIVSAGLGSAIADDPQPAKLLLIGAVLVMPVWVAGALWMRLWIIRPNREHSGRSAQNAVRLWGAFAPFVLMATLLLGGAVVGTTGFGLVDFLFMPKGALLCAAVLALMQTEASARRECLDASVRRTGSLLLVIGAASAFGSVLTEVLSLNGIISAHSGASALLALFALTVAFKLAQGSSMATFAAAAPVAAPMVAATGIEPAFAVFAICLGSFVAILPNDSYYWLIRSDALKDETREGVVIAALASATLVQAAVGMSLLMIGYAAWT